MGLNTMLQVFLPKDKVFSPLFEDTADTIENMAVLLNQITGASGAEKRAGIYAEIENLERKNDDTTHRIFAELGRNFITPYDREHIHYNESVLDDIADYIYSSAKKINLHNADAGDDTAKILSSLTEAAVKEIKVAVYGLRSMKNIPGILQALLKVNSLRVQANNVYDAGIEKLFSRETDMKMLVKKRDIYYSLERVVSRCTDAVNVMETIILKYA